MREHLVNISLRNGVLFGRRSAHYKLDFAAMGGVIYRRLFTRGTSRSRQSSNVSGFGAGCSIRYKAF
jgi:hypothetical protein